MSTRGVDRVCHIALLHPTSSCPPTSQAAEGAADNLFTLCAHAILGERSSTASLAAPARCNRLKADKRLKKYNSPGYSLPVE